MRPRDFPERKNRRRKAVLSRIDSRRANTVEQQAALNQETLALYERIVPSAFGARSRKIGGPGILNRRTVPPKATD
jgi:hypothetical protein